MLCNLRINLLIDLLLLLLPHLPDVIWHVILNTITKIRQTCKIGRLICSNLLRIWICLAKKYQIYSIKTVKFRLLFCCHRYSPKKKQTVFIILNPISIYKDLAWGMNDKSKIGIAHV